MPTHEAARVKLTAHRRIAPARSCLMFPRDVRWFQATIESADIARLYLVNSGDLKTLSKDTQRLDVAAQHWLGGFRDNDHSLRLQRIVDSGDFDPRTVLVASNPDGPFTILDGNHRATILQARSVLAGQRCFLGIHAQIGEFDCALNPGMPEQCQ